MAILQRDSDGKEQKVSGEKGIQDAAQALGVKFRCRGGGCGTCRTTIVEGLENLSLPSRNELIMREKGELEANERLMCQARIEGGVVVIQPQPPRYDALGNPIKPKADSQPQCPAAAAAH